jgi:mxaK protein
VRRRVVHCAFGVVALLCAGLTAHQGWLLYRSNRTNAATASANASDFDPAVPEARFARALALARAGESESAMKAYKALLRDGRRDLRERALFNLGNLYLHDALQLGAIPTFESLPLVELAKQSYRDLLREAPADWDARYNLERALRLAPESEQQVEEEAEPPSREQSMSTVQGARIDLP